MLMQVAQLTHSFGRRRLFNNISLQLKTGDIVRLTGPNGSGKSTFMQIVAGLRKADCGTIQFKDDLPNFIWLPADANGLNQNLSALENLKFWSHLAGSPFDSATVENALHIWGLGGAYRSQELPVRLFSTGMKRRLALSRLEVVKKPVWFLDEPLFGLDEEACGLLGRALQNHIQTGGAALLITHDDRLLSSLPHSTIYLGDAT
jgi:heme exporter protein A